jgi:hypothetical protein
VAQSSVRTQLPNRGTHYGVHLKVLFEKRQNCQGGLDILLIAPDEGREILRCLGIAYFISPLIAKRIFRVRLCCFKHAG